MRLTYFVRFTDGAADLILQTMIQQAYRMFKLFHGPFECTSPPLATWSLPPHARADITKTYGLPTLKEKLQSFFPPFLQSLSFENLHLFAALDGTLSYHRCRRFVAYLRCVKKKKEKEKN
jgi:hypothetical protein